RDQQSLSADFALLTHLQIDEPDGSIYSQVFGGTDADAITSYLQPRVHYILPDESEFRSVGDDFSDSSGSAQVVASNLGTALWFEGIAQGEDWPEVRVGRTQVKVNSSRTGIIMLGSAYSSFDSLI